MEKRQMRQMLRSRISEISTEQREVASREIFSEIATLPAFRKAQVVALYAALHDEPQSREFIAEWYGRKRIVLPRVEGDVMRFYDYSPEHMISGSFGIDEPQGPIACPPEEIDFMVVPGVGFTIEGGRMGRGKGFYDRYLSQPLFRAFTVGVCFKAQIAESLPSEPHDKGLDLVVAR